MARALKTNDATASLEKQTCWDTSSVYDHALHGECDAAAHIADVCELSCIAHTED